MTTRLNSNRRLLCRVVALAGVIVALAAISSQTRADTGLCNGTSITLPFTDVPSTNGFFCAIAQAYFTGLTSGSSPTTYSPAAGVTREQMAAFLTRGMDQSLKRGSKRAVAEKWWTPRTVDSLTLTTVGFAPKHVKFDGTDLWVANTLGASVMRVRPGDGKVLDTWTGAASIGGIVAAMGKIFITGAVSPGKLYVIDPKLPAGAVSTLSSGVGPLTQGVAFDGARIWTANFSTSVSIVTFNPTAVATIPTGSGNLVGILYDGSNIWVTDRTANALLKLNSDAGIVQTINVGSTPNYPVFDGTNIWVPNSDSDSVTVVRVKDAVGNPLTTAFELATLTGNGLNHPITLAFDGERILATNEDGNSVSLWKAADLTPLGSFPTGANTEPFGACSDGLNFWISLSGGDRLARF